MKFTPRLSTTMIMMFGCFIYLYSVQLFCGNNIDLVVIYPVVLTGGFSYVFYPKLIKSHRYSRYIIWGIIISLLTATTVAMLPAGLFLLIVGLIYAFTNDSSIISSLAPLLLVIFCIFLFFVGSIPFALLSGLISGIACKKSLTNCSS